MIPRVSLALALLGIVCAAASVRELAGQESRKIRYGTTLSVAHLPVYVARDAELFARHGLEVEPIHIRGGALITMAIMSGNLQFSGAGAESVVAARIEGGDVVLLACPVDADPVYLVARPETKSPAQLKGKATGVTRLGSTTHFYLRAALRHVGLDPEKDMTILQLGAGAEIAGALESGRIAAAALTIRWALPFLQRGWPLLVDLSKTDVVYPPSCVTSSRAFVRQEPKRVQDFLAAYVEAIGRIKKDPAFAERVFARWSRETDANVVKKSVEAYAQLFKPEPYVPDRGLDNVLRDLALRRPVPRELFGRPELFRDHGPLEKVLAGR